MAILHRVDRHIQITQVFHGAEDEDPRPMRSTWRYNPGSPFEVHMDVPLIGYVFTLSREGLREALRDLARELKGTLLFPAWLADDSGGEYLRFEAPLTDVWAFIAETLELVPAGTERVDVDRAIARLRREVRP